MNNLSCNVIWDLTKESSFRINEGLKLTLTCPNTESTWTKYYLKEWKGHTREYIWYFKTVDSLTMLYHGIEKDKYGYLRLLVLDKVNSKMSGQYECLDVDDGVLGKGYLTVLSLS